MEISRRRLFALGSALLLCALVMLCAFILQASYLSADYPGATRLSSKTMVQTRSGLAIKRTHTYRTDDPFARVYTWYSRRFSLGPESHAQGTCILMGRSFTTLWLVKEQITVTLCNTPNGQMAFVSRSSVVPFGW